MTDAGRTAARIADEVAELAALDRVIDRDLRDQYEAVLHAALEAGAAKAAEQDRFAALFAAPVDPLGSGPACPHCGGGPVLPTALGYVCKSCARIIARRQP